MAVAILRLTDQPMYRGQAAQWFHEKWGVPLSDYLASMDDCLAGARVPQWYLAVDKDRIVAGMGVIDNDFHDRKDLAPNVCAVYTEPAYRGRGLAGALLRFVCDDMAARGIETLYLVTDHIGFYEQYGWRYLCPVLITGDDTPARMYIHRAENSQSASETKG